MALNPQSNGKASTAAGLVQFKIYLPQKDKVLEFPAFLSSLEDSYTANWKTEQAYGFQDQIGIFQGTSRVVNVGLRIIPENLQDAVLKQIDLNNVVQSLYPTYDDDWIPQSSPIIGIKLANLLSNKGGYLYGFLDGFALTPSFEEAGLFQFGNVLLPKLWDVSFNFNVIHKERPGFNKKGFTNGGEDMFPVVANEEIMNKAKAIEAQQADAAGVITRRVMLESPRKLYSPSVKTQAKVSTRPRQKAKLR